MSVTTRISDRRQARPDSRRAVISGGPGGREPSEESRSSTRVLKPRRAAPADAVRPTRAEINLEALRHNLHVVKRHAGSARCWAVLKADGYGHGGPAVARTLERAGADGFCVALLEEAVELREAGIVAPILVMGGYYGGAPELVARGLTPVVYDLSQVEGLARALRAGTLPPRRDGKDGPYPIHLKVDTGMARLGVTMDELPAFAERLAKIAEVRVSGFMTHLACADAATLEETAEQMRRFEEATRLLERHGIRAEVRHAANTAALLRGQALYDAVRPGLAIFGAAPPLGSMPRGDSPRTDGSFGLRPVMRVRTEVVAVRSVAEGAAIGYGATWRARRPSRIATIPMGYADGLSRQLGNRGHVLVRGKRAPIAGAVSMDMSMLDVTDIPGVQARDEAVVLGPQEGPCGKDVLTADEVAERAGTIPWEIMTSISRRVPRFYREP
jgi:alanine racemase